MGDYVVLMGRETTFACASDLSASCFICSLEVTASIAALLFDYCLTFDSEVRWTWGRKWGIVRIAFVISRYTPIATIVMYLYYILDSGGIRNPGMYIAINGTLSTCNAAAADAMLVARAQAFCQWGVRTLIAIILLCTAIIVVALTIIYVVTSKPGDAYVFEGEEYVSIAYGLGMVYQLLLMSLILHKRFKFYRQNTTPLVTNVYRDGVIYVLCIALASMVNCIGIAVLPVNNIMLSQRSPQAVVYSVISSRILFNLRETSESQDDVVISLGMVFSQPVGISSTMDHLELEVIETA
ncbi:uncharacterized protein HD556DRAFT_1535152 [Suillus plorans]|uniref:DUF6533 domain-containing protein n=1 Tax=Suillus plorans TaxID=116603 RepID=A0A9P7DKZ8_9AGAM|nr:uncharacterized protein HD556DRAFT_1535152 [Suillus plorans]KAG1797424.1 hypothetical protein HD556DRAFT_1535152 [Suillus plorans]